MKNYSKLAVLIFTIVSVLTCDYIPVLAYTSMVEAHDANNDQETIESYNVSYQMDGENVIEITVAVSSDGTATCINRTITPEGSDILEIIEDGKITETCIAQNNNYEEFYKIANHLPFQTVNSGHMCNGRGTDMTGSQYAHVYVGSSSTTFQNNEMAAIISSTVSYLASRLMNRLGITSQAAHYFATVILGLITYTYPHHMTVSKWLYEVRTSYDNTYLMHCYHVFTYLYDSYGIMISNNTDYYQVIGG